MKWKAHDAPHKQTSFLSLLHHKTQRSCHCVGFSAPASWNTVSWRASCRPPTRTGAGVPGGEEPCRTQCRLSSCTAACALKRKVIAWPARARVWLCIDLYQTGMKQQNYQLLWNHEQLSAQESTMDCYAQQQH